MGTCRCFAENAGKKIGNISGKMFNGFSMLFEMTSSREIFYIEKRRFFDEMGNFVTELISEIKKVDDTELTTRSKKFESHVRYQYCLVCFMKWWTEVLQGWLLTKLSNFHSLLRLFVASTWGLLEVKILGVKTT